MVRPTVIFYECFDKENDLQSVKRLALAFEGVDDVHGSDSLAAGVFGVSNRITNDIFKEHLEDATSLLVNETTDALHTTTTGETADSRLGDTLDVIAKNLAVTLGAALSKAFASFSTSGHVVVGES